MEIATIGFTRTSAQHFFERLNDAGVKRVVDVRLHNHSQLAGFAKQPDLEYFLGGICSAAYEHDLRLAPTDELLRRYRNNNDWDRYEKAFRRLMGGRKVVDILDRRAFEIKTVLLCAEATAEHCHRRLVAEMLAERWDAGVEHL